MPVLLHRDRRHHSPFRIPRRPGIQRGVVFRLGRFAGLRGPGLYLRIIPLGIDRAVTIDIRTRTVSAESQGTITGTASR